MATIYDVAREAGVSKTLVSRVINGQGGVSEASTKKIRKAMEELNYIPSAIARSLVLQKTKVIGVILDNLCETYFFNLIKGIEDKTASTDYEVVFTSAHNDSGVKNRYIDFFSQGRTDGMILYGSNIGDDSVLEHLTVMEFPCVVVEND